MVLELKAIARGTRDRTQRLSCARLRLQMLAISGPPFLSLYQTQLLLFLFWVILTCSQGSLLTALIEPGSAKKQTWVNCIQNNSLIHCPIPPAPQILSLKNALVAQSRLWRLVGNEEARISLIRRMSVCLTCEVQGLIPSTVINQLILY